MTNLVVCCDGTWNTAEQRHDGAPVPINVVRLYNALADENKGIKQLKYYHPGVGTEAGWLDRAMGGATGKGLDANIKSAYHWLCRNYQVDADIYLFGFSRGAYTVRSLGGMIARCGLLDLNKVKGESRRTPSIARAMQGDAIHRLPAVRVVDGKFIPPSSARPTCFTPSSGLS